MKHFALEIKRVLFRVTILAFIEEYQNTFLKIYLALELRLQYELNLIGLLEKKVARFSA
jgi:hypothetical protein